MCDLSGAPPQPSKSRTTPVVSYDLTDRLALPHPQASRNVRAHPASVEKDYWPGVNALWKSLRERRHHECQAFASSRSNQPKTNTIALSVWRLRCLSIQAWRLGIPRPQWKKASARFAATSVMPLEKVGDGDGRPRSVIDQSPKDSTRAPKRVGQFASMFAFLKGDSGASQRSLHARYRVYFMQTGDDSRRRCSICEFCKARKRAFLCGPSAFRLVV